MTLHHSCNKNLLILHIPALLEHIKTPKYLMLMKINVFHHIQYNT